MKYFVSNLALLKPTKPEPVESWPSDLVRDVVRTCKGAVGKKAADLTEQERFAIALCAGVTVVGFQPTQTNGRNMTVKLTLAPCCIHDDGKGGFVVASK